jgi:hypothetical protein
MLNGKEYNDLFIALSTVTGFFCLIIGAIGFGLWKLISYFIQ